MKPGASFIRVALLSLCLIVGTAIPAAADKSIYLELARRGSNYELRTTWWLVVATQYPIENDGTFPLPEAQLDRFLMYVVRLLDALDSHIYGQRKPERHFARSLGHFCERVQLRGIETIFRM